MKRALRFIPFVIALACNNPTGVGGPCTVSTDCDLGQSCSTSESGGFCTKTCSFEGARIQECPMGSVCTSIGNQSLVCAPICSTASACREKYACVEVGSAIKACKPTR